MHKRRTLPSDCGPDQFFLPRGGCGETELDSPNVDNLDKDMSSPLPGMVRQLRRQLGVPRKLPRKLPAALAQAAVAAQPKPEPETPPEAASPASKRKHPNKRMKLAYEVSGRGNCPFASRTMSPSVPQQLYAGKNVTACPYHQKHFPFVRNAHACALQTPVLKCFMAAAAENLRKCRSMHTRMYIAWALALLAKR